jgi:hypothetical protein
MVNYILNDAAQRPAIVVECGAVISGKDGLPKDVTII